MESFLIVITIPTMFVFSFSSCTHIRRFTFLFIHNPEVRSTDKKNKLWFPFLCNVMFHKVCIQIINIQVCVLKQLCKVYPGAYVSTWREFSKLKL